MQRLLATIATVTSTAGAGSAGSREHESSVPCPLAGVAPTRDVCRWPLVPSVEGCRDK